jgi:hypothetical protein
MLGGQPSPSLGTGRRRLLRVESALPEELLAHAAARSAWRLKTSRPESAFDLRCYPFAEEVLQE